jgi:isoaspartyl peptidase/L-asparaginase-like protein (Ntn-hydrolase superfamily)
MLPVLLLCACNDYYTAISDSSTDAASKPDESHDTVGMLCLDSEGHMAAGTSTSGWPFKVLLQHVHY